MRFAGILYRALNPIFAREPLSGLGAATYGGRFNRRGIPALYTSLSIVTALRESNRVGSFQPTTLVSYEADIANIFDARDATALASYDISYAALGATDWREDMRRRGAGLTQVFADQLIAARFDGLLVRSFAPGTTEADLNLVLWSWSDALPHLLRVVDDEKRLS